MARMLAASCLLAMVGTGCASLVPPEIKLEERALRRSLRLLRMAVSDYRAGRLGKRVDPEAWDRDRLGRC